MDQVDIPGGITSLQVLAPQERKVTRSVQWQRRREWLDLRQCQWGRQRGVLRGPCSRIWPESRIASRTHSSHRHPSNRTRDT